jgi:hypothetical protein
MKKSLLLALEYYAIASAILALVSLIWVFYMKSEAEHFLGFGYMINIIEGPISKPTTEDYNRLAKFFYLHVAVGTVLEVFFIWPFWLWKLFTDRSFWRIYEVSKP